MDERPQQPPEGRLIQDAAEACGLSIREASRRAGISYGRWRQITSGVQHVSPGVTAPVRAPAATLARMAHVVGIAPERLETKGERHDAAVVLREILAGEHHSPVAVPAREESALSGFVTAADDPADDLAAALFPQPGEDAKARRMMFRAGLAMRLIAVAGDDLADLFRVLNRKGKPASLADDDSEQGLGAGLPACPR